MRVAIYARVSTDDRSQDPENQLRELRDGSMNSGHAISGEYIDYESGRKGATSAGNSRLCSTTRPSGNSTAFCSGRWTDSAARA